MNPAKKSKSLSVAKGAAKSIGKFPKSVREDLGYMMESVTRGETPTSATPIPLVGPGAMELRAWDEQGTFRVIYVAKFPEVVHLLHAFQKKNDGAIPKAEIDTARARYNNIS